MIKYLIYGMAIQAINTAGLLYFGAIEVSVGQQLIAAILLLIVSVFFKDRDLHHV